MRGFAARSKHRHAVSGPALSVHVRSCPFVSVRGGCFRLVVCIRVGGCRKRSFAAECGALRLGAAKPRPAPRACNARHRGKALRFSPNSFCRFRKESESVCRRAFKFRTACEIPKSCLRRHLRRLTPALPGLPPPPRLRRTSRVLFGNLALRTFQCSPLTGLRVSVLCVL